jgi:hypothetical protein
MKKPNYFEAAGQRVIVRLLSTSWDMSYVKLKVEITGKSFGTEICLKAESSFGGYKKLIVLC